MIAIQVISTSLQTATSAKSHAIDTVTLGPFGDTVLTSRLTT